MKKKRKGGGDLWGSKAKTFLNCRKSYTPALARAPKGCARREELMVPEWGGGGIMGEVTRHQNLVTARLFAICGQRMLEVAGRPAPPVPCHIPLQAWLASRPDTRAESHLLHRFLEPIVRSAPSRQRPCCHDTHSRVPDKRICSVNSSSGWYREPGLGG